MSDSTEKIKQFDQKEKIFCKDAQAQHPAPERLLRVRQVLERVTISKSLWWKWVASGQAPAAIKLSPKVTCWKESDINALIARLVQPQAKKV